MFGVSHQHSLRIHTVAQQKLVSFIGKKKSLCSDFLSLPLLKKKHQQLVGRIFYCPSCFWYAIFHFESQARRIEKINDCTWLAHCWTQHSSILSLSSGWIMTRILGITSASSCEARASRASTSASWEPFYDCLAEKKIVKKNNLHIVVDKKHDIISSIYQRNDENFLYIAKRSHSVQRGSWVIAQSSEAGAFLQVSSEHLNGRMWKFHEFNNKSSETGGDMWENGYESRHKYSK